MVKPPENESKRERFRRLATLRTNSVLRRLRILGNCANKGSYDYTEEEVRKIFNSIDEELQLTKTKFKNPKREEFKL